MSNTLYLYEKDTSNISLMDYGNYYFTNNPKEFYYENVLSEEFNHKFKYQWDSSFKKMMTILYDWYKLKVVNVSSKSKYFVFSSQNVDTLTYYEVRGGKVTSRKITGDDIDPNTRDFYSTDNGIPVFIPANDSLAIYYKTSHNWFIKEFTNLSRYNKLNFTTLLEDISFFAIGISILIFVFFFALNTREKYNWYYIFIIFSLLINLLIVTKYYLYFTNSPKLHSYFRSEYLQLLSLLILISSTLFTKEFLKIKNYFRKINKYLNYFIYLNILSIIVPVILISLKILDTSSIKFFTVLPFLVFMANTVILFFVSYKIFRKGTRSSLFVVISWLPIVLFLTYLLIYVILLIVYPDINKVITEDSIFSLFTTVFYLTFFFQTFGFLFAIAYQSKITKRELSDKIISTRKLELQNEFEQKEKGLIQSLLYNVLPVPIAERLKNGESVIADYYNEVSVIFIDISDFTQLSSLHTPNVIVTMLNDVFTLFDKVSLKHGLEKIKTIGDCYMAASGVPVSCDDHPERTALMALEVIDIINTYKAIENIQLKVRVGLDCGPIVAGVIGEQKYIYDLWGDTVNMASRMEESGVVGKIQCTESFMEKLNSRGKELIFGFEERGLIDIKGKGNLKTFFLFKKDSEL